MRQLTRISRVTQPLWRGADWKTGGPSRAWDAHDKLRSRYDQPGTEDDERQPRSAEMPLQRTHEGGPRRPRDRHAILRTAYDQWRTGYNKPSSDYDQQWIENDELQTRTAGKPLQQTDENLLSDLEVFDLDITEKALKIKKVDYVASYNWLNIENPRTILVPGQSRPNLLMFATQRELTSSRVTTCLVTPFQARAARFRY